ncbi:hypothetical protein BS78_03G386300 [Paspalum vaginatum]|nr:hypothetical protein BS78_03G386300 [Paspalum vaginatum]
MSCAWVAARLRKEYSGKASRGRGQVVPIARD